MNNQLKNGLNEELNILKIKTKKAFKQSLMLSKIIIGWLMMLVFAPIAAANISNEGIYPLLGGLFVLFIFFLGAQIISDGIEGLEEINKIRTLGEILKGLPSLPPGTKTLSIDN